MTPGGEEWLSIHREALTHFLERAKAGEDPGMLMLEIWANTDPEEECDHEWLTGDASRVCLECGHREGPDDEEYEEDLNYLLFREQEG